MRIAIAGGGIAGLCAALGLARTGHQVTVVERDPRPSLDADPLAWPRPGVPQYLQPHVLLALGCNQLRAHAPDVYADVIASGGLEIRMSQPDLPPDPDLRSLCFRRGLLERALHRALAAEPLVTIHHGEQVQGIDAGLIIRGGKVPGDLVIDALGRSSSLSATPAQDLSCGMKYYSRYYRLRDDNPQRPAGMPIPVRLDLGYAAAFLFWADNRHVALIITVPNGATELQGLRDDAAYDRIVALMPGLTAYIGPDAADPVTSVRPMGSLRSSWREPSTADGSVLTIGDAWCHTNPWYGWGMSLAITQAFAAARLAARPDVAEAFRAEQTPLAWDRFTAATALDASTARYWAGEKLDFLDPVAHPELFRTRALGLAGLTRPDIAQRMVRFVNLLDPTSALDSDVDLHTEAIAAARATLAKLTPPELPTRQAFLAAL